MTEPHQSRCPAQKSGKRVYTVCENQLYGLLQGWTHTSLFDKKNIVKTIEEDNPLAPHSDESSDKVLDDFIDWCKDAISSLEEKQCDGYKQFADVVKIELLHHELKIIKELSTKEREQG